MTVLDLINKSAVMLNIPEVLNDDKILTITPTNERDVVDGNFALKRLYEFSKIVLNEINSCITQKIADVVSILDNIDLPTDVGDDVLVCGLNAYYSLAVGLFAEYNVYKKHYQERLSKLKNLKVFAMPCRSWQ